MLDAVEIDGTWWLPAAPTREIPGTLAFGADGFQLVIRGLLVAPKLVPGVQDIITGGEDPLDVPVIHGTSHDGRQRVTVLGAWGHSLGLPFRHGHETWFPSAAIVGAHLPATARFDRMSFSTEHLDGWVGGRPVHCEIRLGPDELPSEFSVRASHETVATAEVPRLGSVSLENSPEYRYQDREAFVASRPRIVVVPRRPASWETCYESAVELRNLVRLAARAPCAIDDLRLRLAVRDQRGREEWVGLLIRTAAMTKARPKLVRGYDMCFRATTLPGGFQRGLQRWHSMSRRYRPAWNLLTGADDLRVVDPPERFVALARVLEFLHATDIGRSAGADAEHAERVRRALDHLPDDLRPWAQPLLEDSSPPVARHRLMEVLSVVGPVGRDLAGGDPAMFAVEVTATRNLLVHPNARRTRHVLESGEIYWYGKAMEWVATAYLLRRLGFAKARVAEIVRQYRLGNGIIETMAQLVADRRSPPEPQTSS